jgi:peptidoglycan/LPS O-acetylase OafA/YrhL
VVRDRIAFLDGWRAIAVSTVVVAHALMNANYVTTGIGIYGVYIFFLISGYIITSLTVQEVQATGSFSQRDFIVRRALRILPPLLLYTSAILMLQNSDPSIPWLAIRGIAFTCNISESCDWIFGHTWSLAFEEQFYLLFPFLVVRRMNVFIIPVLALYLLPLVFPIPFIGTIGFPKIAALFALGAAYAVHQQKVDALLPSNTVFALLVLAGIVLVLWSVFPRDALAWTVLKGVLLPPIVFLVVFGLPARFGGIKALLSNPAFTRIGLYSYSIYLWQEFFLRPGTLDTPLDVVVAVAATLAISALSYHTFEQVFRNLSRRFHHAHRMPVAIGHQTGFS